MLEKKEDEFRNTQKTAVEEKRMNEELSKIKNSLKYVP